MVQYELSFVLHFIRIIVSSGGSLNLYFISISQWMIDNKSSCRLKVGRFGELVMVASNIDQYNMAQVVTVTTPSILLPISLQIIHVNTTIKECTGKFQLWVSAPILLFGIFNVLCICKKTIRM
jgi:uncharacterized protein YhhL (DUF1145 family)